MKQSEIDRWMRRQARRDAHKTLPIVNWAFIASLVVVAIVCLFLLLKLIHMS